MNIIFCDMNPDVTRELELVFYGDSRVTVVCGDIRMEKGDALVSPANSYGWMDGGIDAVYLNMFGYQLQVRLQSYIAEHFNGLLPVGEAAIIRTMGMGRNVPQWLISAPTMEVPMNVAETENAYLALRAALIAAGDNPRIRTLLCPGLCSLTGGMAPKEMARQMRRAFHEVLN